MHLGYQRQVRRKDQRLARATSTLLLRYHSPTWLLPPERGFHLSRYPLMLVSSQEFLPVSTASAFHRGNMQRCLLPTAGVSSKESAGPRTAGLRLRNKCVRSNGKNLHLTHRLI